MSKLFYKGVLQFSITNKEQAQRNGKQTSHLSNGANPQRRKEMRKLVTVVVITLVVSLGYAKTTLESQKETLLQKQADLQELVAKQKDTQNLLRELNLQIEVTQREIIFSNGVVIGIETEKREKKDKELTDDTPADTE